MSYPARVEGLGKYALSHIDFYTRKEIYTHGHKYSSFLSLYFCIHINARSHVKINSLSLSPPDINFYTLTHKYKHSLFLSLFIIIKLCRQHGYPWPSLATSPYHSSFLAGLQGYIPYPHIAAICMFELVVLLLLGHMRGSIGVHHWWVRPCFSSSVLHVWFV